MPISDFQRKRKIVHLIGTPLTPEVVLARTLEKASRIKTVAIVIMWDDDTFACDWSQQKVGELCMATKIFDAEVQEAMFTRGDS